MYVKAHCEADISLRWPSPLTESNPSTATRPRWHAQYEWAHQGRLVNSTIFSKTAATSETILITKYQYFHRSILKQVAILSNWRMSKIPIQIKMWLQPTLFHRKVVLKVSGEKQPGLSFTRGWHVLLKLQYIRLQWKTIKSSSKKQHTIFWNQAVFHIPITQKWLTRILLIDWPRPVIHTNVMHQHQCS